MKDVKPKLFELQNFIKIFDNIFTVQKLVASMKDKGLKLILDFVPNHSSDKHEWFEKSVAKEDPYTDFYVWKKGQVGTPPNNWVRISFFFHQKKIIKREAFNSTSIKFVQTRLSFSCEAV